MKGGKREKKKDVLVMWISYKRTCKIQWTQQCRHPSQLPASHRFVFKHFYLKKKNFKTDQQCSDFKEKSRSNLVSVVYVTKAKKKKSKASGWWHDPSVFMSIIFFFYVFVSFSLTQPNTLKVKRNWAIVQYCFNTLNEWTDEHLQWAQVI